VTEIDIAKVDRNLLGIGDPGVQRARIDGHESTLLSTIQWDGMWMSHGCLGAPFKWVSQKLFGDAGDSTRRTAMVMIDGQQTRRNPPP
jgi:hypothetical protein